MKRRILMKPVIKSYAVLLGLVLGLALFFASPGPAHAQIQISRSISVQENVPDMGDLVNQYTWSQSGFVIDSVKVNLIFSSPVSTDPMWLGQLVVTLTHGLPSEAFRSQLVLDRRGVTVSDPFGDSSSSLNEEIDLGGTVFAGNWLASDAWTLSVSDMQAGGIAKLESYTLTVSGVPEPSSASMLILGLAAVLASRRRTRLHK